MGNPRKLLTFEVNVRAPACVCLFRAVQNKYVTLHVKCIIMSRARTWYARCGIAAVMLAHCVRVGCSVALSWAAISFKSPLVLRPISASVLVCTFLAIIRKSKVLWSTRYWNSYDWYLMFRSTTETASPSSTTHTHTALWLLLRWMCLVGAYARFII